MEDMTRGGKVIWGLVKWIGLPAALAYVGYAYYGPMIGKQPPQQLVKLEEKILPKTPPIQKPNPTVESVSGDSEKNYTPPEVEVNVLKRDGKKLRDPQDIPGSSPSGDAVPEPTEAGSTSNL